MGRGVTFKILKGEHVIYTETQPLKVESVGENTLI